VKHIHHESIDSTSLFLKNHFKSLIKEAQQILVSTDKQTQGRGRSDHGWEQPKNSLAFSFTLKPCNELTLTSLELGILLSQFLKGKLFLKWPNDIINLDYKKCGGILCQLIDRDHLVIGIGLNLGHFNESDYDFDYPIGAIDPHLKLNQQEYKSLPFDIYQFILKNRMKPEEIISTWSKYCFHTNKKVKIIDGSTINEGLFKGINKDGAALLEIEGKEKIIMCGSLFVTHQ
jgi:BirA family transcriptional regulator, biotin operon repressor / biotin---[acetyl-CoA-carboxylase] ligase